jgi:hypothetical protein
MNEGLINIQPICRKPRTNHHLSKKALQTSTSIITLRSEAGVHPAAELYSTLPGPASVAVVEVCARLLRSQAAELLC